MKTKKTAEKRWEEDGLSLKEVSQILDIPTSTLRYWDKEGLVTFVRNWQNDYRHVSLGTLLDLVDVLDYRDMDVPIGKIKRTSQMTADELLALLDEHRTGLQAKITKLQQVLAKVGLKEQALQRLKALEQKKPTLVYRQMPPIYRVDLQNTEDIKKSLVPFQAANLFQTDNIYNWQAGMWTKNSSGEIIRAADKHPMPYLNGLMRVGRENDNGNADQLILLADNLGYRSQYVIYQYLCTARHPEYGLCDYHEYWMDLVKK